MNNIWRILTFYDKLLIISLIIISVFFIVSPLKALLAGGGDADGYEVVIQSAHTGQQRIPLGDTYGKNPIFISVEGPIGVSIVEVYQGKVRLKEAPEDDPEKICEKTGWISEPGPMIVCVPNQISIWIEGRNSDLDGVSW